MNKTFLILSLCVATANAQVTGIGNLQIGKTTIPQVIANYPDNISWESFTTHNCAHECKGEIGGGKNIFIKGLTCLQSFDFIINGVPFINASLTFYKDTLLEINAAITKEYYNAFIKLHGPGSISTKKSSYNDPTPTRSYANSKADIKMSKCGSSCRILISDRNIARRLEKKCDSTSAAMRRDYLSKVGQLASGMILPNEIERDSSNVEELKNTAIVSLKSLGELARVKKQLELLGVDMSKLDKWNIQPTMRITRTDTAYLLRVPKDRLDDAVYLTNNKQ